MERTVNVGEVYRHFKGNVYEIVALAVNADNREQVVVYKSLSNGKVFVRSYAGFVGEVNKNKYPDSPQKYRFELVSDEAPDMEEEDAEIIPAVPLEIPDSPVKAAPEEPKMPKQAPLVGEKPVYEAPVVADGDIHPMLMEFLETKSFDQKLQILRRMEPEMTDKLIDDMAASLDVVIHDGDMSDRIRELKTCLTTFDKFDCSDRLR